MMSKPKPQPKRIAGARERFWNVVAVLESREGTREDAWREALVLAKYMLNHGGYYRLADSVLAIAEDVWAYGNHGEDDGSIEDVPCDHPCDVVMQRGLPVVDSEGGCWTP